MIEQPLVPNSAEKPTQPGGVLVGSPRPLWPGIVSAVVVVATIAQLHRQGRQWWCDCGQWSPWSSDVWGPHNSQHFLDPYSFTHLSHGILLCGLLTVAIPWLAASWRLTLSVCIECVWEILENSAAVIARYRTATAALGYEGDSIANSIGDILSCVAGFWLARRLGFRRSLAVLVALELLLLYWIRDNLTLNVLMLLYPFEAIRTWQQGG